MTVLTLTSLFRIAIWNRNIIVSLVAVGVWLGALALNIRRTFISPVIWAIIASSYVPCLWLQRHSNSELYKGFHLRRYELTHANHKFASTVTYNPVVEICAAVHARRSLIDAIGVFVVDTVLLLTMLIGLIRCANENSAGIWKLLYQQVTLKTVFSSCAGC